MASPYPQDMLDRPGDGPAERRRAPRHALPLSGRWRAEGRWVHMMVDTISIGGAALTGLVPLRPGDQGVFTLEGLDLAIPCDVRWARDGMAGVAFTLSEADSARLQAHIDTLATRGRIHLPCAGLTEPGG